MPLSDEPMFECQFTPYRPGMGPRFILKLFETHRRDSLGKEIVRYQLIQRDPQRQVELFAGDDFACSPLYVIDSVGCAEGLMGFLTLRPGDTDAEYFERYTQEQLEFCNRHAEALHCEVTARWCDENGRLKRRYQ